MIRPFRTEDAAAVVALRHELLPTLPASEPALLHRLRAPASAHAAYWVAEGDGGLVGFATASLRWDAAGLGRVWVGVLRRARRRGLGVALYERAAGHLDALGATKVTTAADDPDGERFAAARGFARGREAVRSVCELGSFRPPPAVAGLELALVTEIDAHALHALDEAAGQDEPMDDPRGAVGFEDWRAELLDEPSLCPQASFAAVVEGRPVAASYLSVDGTRPVGWNEYTCTDPAFRGRGLATAVKGASLAAARALGLERVYTGNDATNAAMLAVNRRLGYRELFRFNQWSREA